MNTLSKLLNNPSGGMLKGPKPGPHNLHRATPPKGFLSKSEYFHLFHSFLIYCQISLQRDFNTYTRITKHVLDKRLLSQRELHMRNHLHMAFISVSNPGEPLFGPEPHLLDKQIQITEYDVCLFFLQLCSGEVFPQTNRG